VFLVEPTGVDDTANLQAAFDAAVAAGPGSVVELAEGNFYLSKGIVVEDFGGTFRGQGSDKSVIHLVPGAPLALRTEPPDLMFLPPAQLFFLVYRTDGLDLRWEKMSLDLVGKAVEWYRADVPGPQNYFWPICVWGVGGLRQVDTTWWDLRVQGDEGPGYSSWCNLGSVLVTFMSGIQRMTNCHFDTQGYGLFFAYHYGSQITVGGPRAADRVTFHNVDYGMAAVNDTNCEIELLNARAWNDEGSLAGRSPNGDIFAGNDVMWIGAPSGLTLRMAGVETENMSGAVVGPAFGSCGQAPSTLLFERNIIRQRPGTEWAGFEMHEDCAAKSEIIIRNNRIWSEGSFPWGPIYITGAVDAVITNNILWGSGPAAMYLGLPGAGDSGFLVKGNNVQGWHVDGGPLEPAWHGAAAIWLGPETSGITVVGSGSLRTKVYDETDDPATPAYDGANILVGVNSQGAHIGQAIRDALLRAIDAKTAFTGAPGY